MTLPNHRVRLAVQIDMLSTFARLSDDHGPVGSEQVADALKVSTNTVSLSSGFFVDSGWLERTGREKYLPTESLLAYHRRVESRPGPAAVALLAAPVRSSWYWQVLQPNLHVGTLSRYDALVLLATEGNTAEEYRPQLESLLEWLDFLELIQVSGDDIVGRGPTPNGDHTSGPDAEQNGHADPESHEPAAPGAPRNRGHVVVALEMDLHLTAADLAAFSPDQIRALFEAVGTVASLTQPRRRGRGTSSATR